jgi:hypothetical protein
MTIADVLNIDIGDPIVEYFFKITVEQDEY